MFDKIFFSTQVNRRVITSYKNDIYELTDQLPKTEDLGS